MTDESQRPNVATVDKIVRALDRAEKGKRK